MGSENHIKNKRAGRFFLWGSGGLLILLSLGLLSVWLARHQIAEYVLKGWCNDQGISCDLEVQTLSLDQASISPLEVQGQGQVPLAANSIEVELSWPALFSPRLESVEIYEPVLRARFEEGQLSFYGLEDVIAGLSSDGQASPDQQRHVPVLKVRGGQVELTTDAGAVTGLFELQLADAQNGTAAFRLEPAELAQGSALLLWSAGDVTLTLTDGVLLGQSAVSIERAQLDGLNLDDVRFNLKLARQDGQVAWDLAADAGIFEGRGLLVSDIAIAADGGLATLQSLEMSSVMDALNEVTLRATTNNIAFAGDKVGGVELDLALKRNGAQLGGPVAFKASNFLATDIASLEDVTAAGEVALLWGDARAFRYQGSLIGRQIDALTPSGAALLETIILPEPLLPHGDQMREGLQQAVSNFDIGLDLDMTLRDNDWSLNIARPTLLKAASGLMVSLEPISNRPWLEAEPGKLDLVGRVSVSGDRRLPSFRVNIDEMVLKPDQISLALRDFRLPPWRVEGRAVSANIVSLEAEITDRLRVLANGQVGLAGTLPGLVLQETSLTGNVRALQGVEGWRVETQNGSCAMFESDGFASGALSFEPMSLSLCPIGGRFFRQEQNRSIGQMSLGSLALPFATDDARGVFELDGGIVEWTTGDGFRLFLKGDRFGAPVMFDDNTLEIRGTRPEVVVALTDGPAQISSTLGRTVFSGTMMPANVVSDAFDFDGVATETGVDGNMRARAVRISDVNASPIYQPMVADLSAELTDGIVEVSGPVLTMAKRRHIADARLNLNLSEFSGLAHITLKPLSFQPALFQPFEVSELLRGTLTNATGMISGEADISIQSGELSGTGNVLFDDLSFDTYSIGPVTGINGTIQFSDVLALTSHGGQVFQVDRINPGLPLQDGVVEFQLIEGRQVQLERAAWPFAGGTLEVLPVRLGLGDTQREVVVEASRLELSALVDTFDVPDLEADGTVSGRFPVEIDGANVWIRNAVLTVDEDGGTLSYGGAGSQVVQGQNEYADYAIQALKDFYFRVMELGIEGNLIGQITLSLEMLGSSPDVLGGAEFELSFSLESNLRQLLQTLSNDAGTTAIIQAYRDGKLIPLSSEDAP